MRFNAYLLSNYTILDSRVALYLVNNKDLLVLELFKKAIDLQSVKAETQAFLILGIGTRVLKRVLNKVYSKEIEDFTFTKVVVVEGFYLNIILEACLKLKGVQYLGFNATLKVETLKENIILANLRAKHYLTFLKYKLLTFYSIIISVTLARKKLCFQTTHLKTNLEELQHRRLGHLGPKALRALVSVA